MISIKGKWFDSLTSAQVEAVCLFYDNGSVRVERLMDRTPLLELKESDINISPRLANTPRRLNFPSGEKFETEENDAVDRLMKRFKRRSWQAVVHRLETYKRYILIAFLLLLLFMWGSVKYGIPQAAKLIAKRLPPSVLNITGRQTLEFLDRSVFAPSELDEQTQGRLIRHFDAVVQNHPGYPLKILFRKGKRVGPNAFALPDGSIIFTDEMVRLAAHDDELLSVFSHEIGHIVHRHALRSIIQDSFLGFALLAITGDITGSSELFLGLPVILTELAYSREFEREADRYALSYLKSNGIPPMHFVRLMRRIEQKAREKSGMPAGKWMNYLSTHPMNDERLRPFEQQQ